MPHYSSKAPIASGLCHLWEDMPKWQRILGIAILIITIIVGIACVWLGAHGMNGQLSR